jgi:hypothetical protein
VHVHFLHVRTEEESAQSAAAAGGQLALGEGGAQRQARDPAASPEACLATFAADFADLESVTADIVDGGACARARRRLRCAAPEAGCLAGSSLPWPACLCNP